MHILMIPSWYKTPQNAIRGSFFTEQALALQNAGHQVAMIVPPSKLRTRNGLAELRRYRHDKNTDILINDDDGFPVYRIPWWGWRASINPWARAELARRIFDVYCEDYGQPDVLHGHAVLYGGFLASTIGKQHNIPSVVTEHDVVFLRGLPLIHTGQRRFIRYTLSTVNRVVAVSSSLARDLQTIVPDAPIQVIGNLVNTALFSPGPGPLPDAPFVFTSIGRLVAGKGHEFLIEALAKHFRDHAVVLKIAGDGPQRGMLKRMAHRLGVEKQTQIVGVLPRAAMPNLIRCSHVVVSASEHETFGITLIEAGACGKPVIAMRSGGPETIVNERNGLLVEYGDVDALANAMHTMIAHYDTYDPAVIRADCVEHFGEQPIVKQLEAMYHEIRSDAKT